MTVEYAMKHVLDSMGNSVKLRSQARAERRAEEAKNAKKDFEQKLMAAEASKTELDSLAMKAKGSEDAVLRDQLMGFMMAGF